MLRRLKKLDAHFEQDKLVQQDMPTHVGEGHTSHNDKASNQKALSPGLERDAHRVGGFVDNECHGEVPVALR